MYGGASEKYIECNNMSKTADSPILFCSSGYALVNPFKSIVKTGETRGLF